MPVISPDSSEAGPDESCTGSTIALDSRSFSVVGLERLEICMVVVAQGSGAVSYRATTRAASG